MKSGNDVSDFLVAVAARLPMVEVVAGVLPLRRSGRSFRGPCPFHQGQNPNFDLSPSRNLAYCFTCGWGGDTVKFIREHPAFPVRGFADALRYLSERTGVAVPPMRGVDAAAEARAAEAREQDEGALRYATRFFAAAAASAKHADGFAAACAACGLSVREAQRVGAGFAPPGGHVFVEAVARHGLAASLWEAMRRLGLLQFDGEAGTPEASATVRDGISPGLVLPVVGDPDWDGAEETIAPFERVFGFVRWAPDGTLVTLTQSCGPLHVPRGIIRVRRTAAAAGLAVWSDAATWRAESAAWTGDAIVPVAPWETPAAIQRIRQLTRMRPTFGLWAGDGTALFWLHPHRMLVVRGITRPAEGIAGAKHACEAALIEDAELDLSDPISHVADEGVRLVLEGWWRARVVQSAT